jgi:hypothetical protein
MKIKILFFFLLLAITPTLFFALDKTMNDDIDNDLYVLPQDCDFMQVPANSSVQMDCSPKLKDPYFSTFKGLLINAPGEVIWPKDVSIDDYVILPDGSNDSPLRFNVAGLSNIPDSSLGLHGDVAYEILIVAVNQMTGQSYSGKMLRMGDPGPEPTGILSGFEQEGIQGNGSDETRTVYFNVDLVSNLNIPLSEAIYTVYATMGEYKSNVLTIKTFIQ